MRRIPVIPTLVVLIVVAILVSLGMWQLRRLKWKEGLLAHYAVAQRTTDEVDWTSKGVGEDLLYRRAHLTCVSVISHSSIAGYNAQGTLGMGQTADCKLPGGGRALVELGWSQLPNAATDWPGGEVHGVIAPGPRLVAVPPLAGLQANATPNPSQIPNNHLSYAIQWFFFATIAVVIYAIALWKRLKRA